MKYSLSQQIMTASGAVKAPFVLKNAHILNVFTGEWINADIALCGQKIAGIGTYSGKTQIDLGGRSVVPGFINTHVHIESTMVTPAQMAAEIVPWGTTTIIADPHEIANVKGLEGIEFMIAQSRNLPCDVYFMLPSCVPALPNEDSGAILEAEDLAKLKNVEGVLGLGEMMNFDGVVAAEKKTLKKLELFSGLRCDGHAPNLVGKALQAYCTAGITTDHECSTEEETIEKLRTGMYILAREGSSAKNTEVILRAIQKAGLPFERVAFCSDDKHIFDIRQKGEIAENIRIAISLGINPADAYRMASYNGALIYGLHNTGAIAPGYKADLVVLEDEKQVRIHSVYKNGQQVSQENKPLSVHTAHIPSELTHTVRYKPLHAKQLRIPITEEKTTIIELIDRQILTKKTFATVPAQNGFFVPNAQYQKIAAIERHAASGKIGLGIVSGFNLNGAIATTVSHDSHNIVVVGSNDADMMQAVEQLEKQQGGFVCVTAGKVLGVLALPICGLMTAEPTDAVLQKLEELKTISHQMGVPKTHDPFITLSFLALPVIPEIRITTHGLVDC